MQSRVAGMASSFESVGRYRLVSLLGEGGMGHVYKAYDSALERHVALKVLRAEMVTDSARVTRFIQEARTASALNHPNVVVIHDIGDAPAPGLPEPLRFIAMELLEGMTLREMIARGAVDIRRALGIMVQVTDALTAAHEAGVVHRDLKPENIIVNATGLAKVLDFGVAKLRAQPESDAGTIKDTDPGTIVGTASYMAPEQALGRPVDERSDIFSVGSILYELITGHRAFSGHSVVDTLHRTIYSEPAPIASSRGDAPRELIRIVRRTLAKDPEDRYQSMKDLSIDLRDLVRELDTNPGAVPVVGSRSSRWWKIAIAAVLAAGGVAIGSFALLRNDAALLPPPSSGAGMRVLRVTATEKAIAAAISPDGAYVAYVVSDQGAQSLWVKQMASGETRQLIAPRRVGYYGVSFGHDGAIYFAEKSVANPDGAMDRISPEGGSPRRIVAHGVDTAPAFSPDGRQMAFLRSRWPEAGKSTLLIANGDGSNVRPLVTVEMPDLLVPIFFAGPSWSPDGRKIATSIQNPKGARLVSVDVATGTITAIADAGWRAVSQSAWLPDSSGLVAIATVDQEDRAHVWVIPYPEGEPYRLTNDLFDYRSVSLTADGKSLVTVAGYSTSDVWVLSEGATPRRLSSSKTEGSHGVTALGDGRIVYTSLDSGNPDLWMMNSEGGGRRVLTRDGQRNRAPVVTPDERYIIYLSNTGMNAELCRINLDGSDRRVLSTQATLSNSPTVSPDSRWVVFQGIDSSPERKGMSVLSRVSIDGGPTVHLTDFAASRPSFSPDGSKIAFYFGTADDADVNIGVIPASGGAPTHTLRATPPLTHSLIAWTPDATALVVNTMPSDRGNLWRLPLDGSKPSRLTNFEENRILSFAPLRGRNGWVVARGDFTRDVVLFSGFR